MSNQNTLFPPLPIEEWEGTKNTLHLFFQIVGKVRLTLFPKMNHWWHVTLYLSPRGMTTRPIPYKDMVFQIDFDFFDHKLLIQTSSGDEMSFSLQGIFVSDFYSKLMDNLKALGIEVQTRLIHTTFLLVKSLSNLTMNTLTMMGNMCTGIGRS